MSPYLLVDEQPQNQLPVNQSYLYNCVANIRHNGNPKDYHFNLHVLHKSSNKWHDIQDLFVEEVMPPLIALSEAYIQIYERADLFPGPGQESYGEQSVRGPIAGEANSSVTSESKS